MTKVLKTCGVFYSTITCTEYLGPNPSPAVDEAKQECMTPAHDPNPGEWGLLAHQGEQPKHWPMENYPEMAPNGAKVFFPANLDLAAILDRTDFHSDSFIYVFCFYIPDSQI